MVLSRYSTGLHDSPELYSLRVHNKHGDIDMDYKLRIPHIDKNTINRNAIGLVLAPSMYSKMLVLPNSACVCVDCVRKNLRTLVYDLRHGYYDDCHDTFTVLNMEMVEDGVHCDECDTLVSDYE